jgi:anti-anti-sigma factor
LSGQIRYPTAQALREFVERTLSQDGSDTVILDLRGVEFVDSTSLGLMARVGRTTLERRGRRAVIVCSDPDVRACLRSAAFDVLFVLTEEWPLDHEIALMELPLGPARELSARSLGRVMLDAHRELASLSPRNEHVFGDVITALEAEQRASTPRRD